jgi:hypothetical protein
MIEYRVFSEPMPAASSSLIATLATVTPPMDGAEEAMGFIHRLH